MHASLQDTYNPTNECFGCGAANPQGLALKSFVEGDHVVAEWTPRPHLQAFPGILCGGIIGTLLDCHSNWTAAWAIMQKTGAAAPPMVVTDEYSVKLLKPAPLDAAVNLTATVLQVSAKRAIVDASLHRGGKVFALCRGTFAVFTPR